MTHGEKVSKGMKAYHAKKRNNSEFPNSSNPPVIPDSSVVKDSLTGEGMDKLSPSFQGVIDGVSVKIGLFNGEDDWFPEMEICGDCGEDLEEGEDGLCPECALMEARGVR